MSDANLTAIGFARETSYGVLAAPALKTLRFTKDGLNHDKMTVESQEIRSDRQTDEEVEVGVEAKGTLDFELSVGDFDSFIEAALMGVWADVGGIGTITNGVTRYSYLIEKKLSGAAFLAVRGAMVDKFTLNLNSRQIVTGQLSFLGQKGVPSGATLDANGAYDAAGTGLILSASANVGNLTLGGVALGKVKSLSLTVENNLRANDVIGKKELDEVGVGECKVTGKLEVYFSDIALYQKFVNHDTAALSFEVTREAAGAASGDVVGYRFTLPKCYFPKAELNIPGKNADVMLPLDFSAKRDATAGHTIKVEKLEKA